MIERKPNILLFFADQFRYDAIRANGGQPSVTPNLDRLCREGMVFDRAYTPSPVCVPARASMLWGRYPCRTGITDNGAPDGFRWDGPNIMETLCGLGYFCHGVGKMHFVPDPDGLNGFSSRERQEELPSDPAKDEYLQYLLSKGYDSIFDIHGQRSEMYYIPQISQLPERDHPTRWAGDRSVEFIRRYDGAQPFFLMASFIHPHPPFSPPAPWNKICRVPEVGGPFVPEDAESLLVHINRVQNRYKFRDNGLDRNLVMAMRAYYFSCVAFVDHQIGRILNALEERGMLGDTLVVFASDHGELLGDYNCFGKRCMLDPSARIPLVLRFPARIPAGVRCGTPAGLTDLYPTFLDAAGAPAAPEDARLDGTSLFAVPSGEPGRHVYSQFSERENGLYMAAGRDEKIIYSVPDDRWIYLDRRICEREERSLEDDARHREGMARMKEDLIRFMSDVPYAVEGSDFRRYPKQAVPEDRSLGLIYQDQPWCARREADSLPAGYRTDLRG